MTEPDAARPAPPSTTPCSPRVAERPALRPALGARPARASTLAGHTRIAHRHPHAPTARRSRCDGRPRRRRRARRSRTSGTGSGRAQAPFGPGRLPHRGPLRRRPSGRATTPTGSCPRSASSTCTSSARAGTSSSGRCSAPTTASTGASSGGVRGTAFTVWAPHARAVRVVGDFNGWDGTGARDAQHGRARASGSCSCPTSTPAPIYKFEILTADGRLGQKADPMARHAEIAAGDRVGRERRAPTTGATATGCAPRAPRDPHDGPMSVYELHLGSWRPGLGYRDVADELIEYVDELGFTHVEFMPLAEHPFGGSWGYQVTGYYAPTSPVRHPRRPEVPHRPAAPGRHRRDHGLGARPLPEGRLGARAVRRRSRSTSTPTRAAASRWTGARYVFDFGNPQVRNFLVANALFWLEEFHVDGLRVDAVASMLYLDYSREDGEWLPNIHGGRENLEAIAFLQEANATAYKRNPGIVMIAEESTVLARRHRAHRRRAGSASASSGTWAGCTTRCSTSQKDPMYRVAPPPRPHVLVPLRLQRALRAADQPRRGRARQGLAARARCRATTGSSSRTCAPTSRTCGRTPASSCCSWARSSASSPSGARSAASTGGSSTSRRTAARRVRRRR